MGTSSGKVACITGAARGDAAIATTMAKTWELSDAEWHDVGAAIPVDAGQIGRDRDVL